MTSRYEGFALIPTQTLFGGVLKTYLRNVNASECFNVNYYKQYGTNWM